MIKMHMITKPVIDTLKQNYFNDELKCVCDEYIVYNPLSIRIPPKGENIMYIKTATRTVHVDFAKVDEIRFEITED